jgi:phosphatidylserine/phosphatidylglycerophosphate/cardiolipin synthase-like enzyme
MVKQGRRGMVRWIVGTIVLVQSFSPPAFADRGEVEYIPPRSYFATVQQEIERAKTSISVYLYLFSFQPNESQSDVFWLAESLTKAHDAGINVEVVLDQNIDFIGEEGASVAAKNLAAYVFLRKKGIPVYFDNAVTYTHAKALIIDEKTVIVGSSNWSRATFDVNEETNVLIRSTSVAQNMLKGLRAIPREEPAPSGPSVPVPTGFLLNNGLFGQMLTRSDERVFDVYFFLLRENAETIILDYEKLAAHVGIDAMGRQG